MGFVSWRTAAVLVGSLLVLSAALNVETIRLSRQYYAELNDVRLDPLGIREFESSATTKSGRRTVVLLGDSRAAQWTALPAGTDLQFVNSGISAQTSEQVLLRFDANVRPAKPDIVVVEVGINDLKTIGIFPERREEIVTRLKANISAIASQSREIGARVVLVTIFPEGAIPLQRRLVWSDKIGESVKAVNVWIRAQETDGLRVLDADQRLAGGDGKIREKYQHDFLHINDEGYKQLLPELGRLLAP